MQTLTVRTPHLLAFLADVCETVSYRGAYLGSTRGPYGAEPGDVTLLVGTSTNGMALGHTWFEAVAGDLEWTLWAYSDMQAVISVFKDHAKRADHTVDISVDGDAVLIRETPALFDSDLELRIPCTRFEDDDETPARWRRMLSMDPLPVPVTPSGEERPDIPRSSWPVDALVPLLRIAKRRKATLHLFRSHAQQLHRVQIGHNWIGVVAPLAQPDHDDPVRPTEDARFDERGRPELNEGISHHDDMWLSKAGILWPEATDDSANDDGPPPPDEPKLGDSDGGGDQ